MTSLLLLVFVAVYMAVGRQFFPFIASYKEDFEAKLAETLSVPVEIGSIEGSWRWLDPVLVISDINVKVNSPAIDAAPMHLNSFYIHLSVVDSILKGKLQFQSIEAEGLRFSLRQNEQGDWEIPGLSTGDNTTHQVETDFTAILAMLEQPSLQISGIQVDLSNSKESKGSWNIPSAIMAYDGKAFSASGRVLHPSSDDPFIQFSAKGAGWIFSNDFTGKLYFDWASGPLLNDLLDAYEWKDIRFEKI